MSAWHNLVARFRKDGDRTAPLDPTAPLSFTSATIDASNSAIGATQPFAATSHTTQQLGDTTQSLTRRAPSITTPRSDRRLSAAALRDIGRERSENQDHCFAQVLTFPTDHADLTLGLFIVADGMGGHHGGGHASKLALSTVVRHVLQELFVPLMAGEQRAPQPIVQAAVQAANAAVYDAGQAVGSDMGTTCTVALLYDHDLIVGHVGDSRALLISGSVRQVTTDHSAVGRLIAIGALSPEEAADHPLRNHLYRTIGQQADVSVDVTTISLRDEQHMVLCSDGLWGLVPDGEIIDIVSEARTTHRAAQQLIDRANQLGGHDNISVVVVRLPAIGAQP